MVQTKIDCHPIQPGTQSGFIGKAQAMAMQPDKYFLGHILGIRPISENAVGRSKHLRVATADNFVKGDVYCAGQSAHECRIEHPTHDETDPASKVLIETERFFLGRFGPTFATGKTEVIHEIWNRVVVGSPDELDLGLVLAKSDRLLANGNARFRVNFAVPPRLRNQAVGCRL